MTRNTAGGVTLGLKIIQYHVEAVISPIGSAQEGMGTISNEVERREVISYLKRLEALTECFRVAAPA